MSDDSGGADRGEHRTADAPAGRRARGVRDVDSANVAFRLKAFGWSLFASVPGALVGGVVGSGTDSPGLFIILFAAGGVAFAYFGSLAMAEYTGRVGATLYFASGRSTRGRREYSLAESLIVRGRLDDALRELERAAARYPDDPEPPLRLARLLRDRCARPDDAVRWFRAAIERSRADAGVEVGALREIIEIYTHVLRTPPRALPYLARLAERHAGTTAAEWARREMAEIRRSLRDEEAGS
jgi:tetratricopeptide (TPR) repeat protein